MTRSAGFLGAALLLGAAAPDDRVISITVTGDDGRAPHAGVAATVQVDVRDPASGTPLGGLTPAMWLVPDEGGDGGVQGGGQCEGLAKSPGRPEGTIDVNGFDVIEATDDGKLSLIDPVLNLASANIKALTDIGAVPRMWASDPAGTLLAIAMPSTRELRLVDMIGLTIVARVPLPAEPSAVIPDGQGFRVGTVDGSLLSLGRDGSILSTQKVGDGPVSLSGNGETIVALARSGDGAFIRGGTMHRFATRERMAAMVFVPLSDAAFALSADGKALLRVSQDEPDAPRRTALQRAARAIAVSPDGHRLALTAADGGAIVIVDVASGRERWTVVANDPIIAADFSDAFLYLVHARQAGATRVVFDPDGGPPGTVIIAAGSPGEREQRPGDLPIMARIPGAGMLIASHRDRAAFRLHDDTPQAPMSSLPLRAGAPAGILVRYRGLLPTAQPGSYSAKVVVPRAGRYFAMVRTEQPAVAHCSRLVVAGSPGAMAAPAAVPTIIARRLSTRASLSPGPQPLRFSISGTPAARLSGVTLVGDGWQMSPADVRSDAQGYSAMIDLFPGRSFTLFVRYRDGGREGILSSTIQVAGR